LSYQFAKHYTPEAARLLLPDVRRWLRRLVEQRSRLEKSDARLTALRAGGADLGGPVVNDWVRTMAEIRAVLVEFQQREIQIKDLDRGLIDFPAIIGDREVFLCWEQGEDDIGFWHDLDSGYSGREPL
jgi:hypothetical protein